MRGRDRVHTSTFASAGGLSRLPSASRKGPRRTKKAFAPSRKARTRKGSREKISLLVAARGDEAALREALPRLAHLLVPVEAEDERDHGRADEHEGDEHALPEAARLVAELEAKDVAERETNAVVADGIEAGTQHLLAHAAENARAAALWNRRRGVFACEQQANAFPGSGISKCMRTSTPGNARAERGAMNMLMADHRDLHHG